jgi:hypothetical protein
MSKKSAFKTILLVFAVLVAMVPLQLFARNVTLINQMSVTVWAGWQGSTIPNGGGVSIAPGASYVLVVPDNWQAARVWGRTGCNDATGHCDTGDCGNKLQCNGAGGIPPASLSEWTLQGSGGLDYYDLSLVDGYNVPMVLQNVGGQKSGNGTKYDCGSPACTSDLNASCPTVLQVKNASGTVVACNSACNYFGSDQYCCKNAYGVPATCPPTSYSQAFKAACPDAYSYAYDDHASTYTCIGGNYNVIFGTSTSTSSTSTSSTSTSSTSTSSTSSSGTSVIPAKIAAATYTAANNVQAESCSEGGQDVGYIAQGSWMVYPISVPTAGSYVITYRVASLSGGGVITPNLDANATVLPAINVPSTGGWQTWTSVTQTVNLPAGTHNFGIYATAAGWNIEWINIASANTVSPSQVSASSYTAANNIQAESCSEGGQDVGYIAQGSWMVYPITVSAAGTYTISYRVASLSGGGVITPNLDANATVLPAVNVPSTGGWQTWTTVTQTVNLPAGTHNFGIYATAAGWNIEWIKFQ